MKKIFTLVVAILAMTLCAKAQVVFSDDFESYAAFTVDPAGSWTYYDVDGASTYGLNGATWTNQYYVGSGIVMNPSQVDPSQSASWAPYSGNQFFAVWDAVPSEIVSGTTTNDWLVTPELTLTDAAIVSFYAREVVATYGPEVVRVLYSTTTNAMSAFTEIQTLSVSAVEWTEYTFSIPANAKYVAINVVSDDVFGFFMDDFSISYVPTEPTIQVPTTMNFATIMASNTAVLQTNVVAYNLTSAITATTTAPFAVSADGTTFATTATLPQAGGTLYVQYAPTAAGLDNGTVELESGSASATIALTGSAFECGIPTIPYFTDFTTDLNDCWTIIDANGDGDGTYGQFSFVPASGYAQYMYNSESSADDWLISPSFTFTGEEVASFDYAVSYPETFQVLALGEDTIPLTQVITTSTSATQNLDLTNLYGEYQLAIHCTSDADQYYLRISNFNVDAVGEGSLTVIGDTMDFNIIANGSVSNPQIFIVETTNLPEDVTISTVAPFEVSLDGITFAATATLPATTEMFTEDTVYVRFAPTTVGTFSENVTIATTILNQTLVVMGESVDCSEGIADFPFEYDFNTGIYPPVCWTVNDEANFSGIALDETGTDKGIIVLALDRLVTPEIHSENALMVSIEHMSYAAATGETPTASTFRIGYSSTNTDPASFSWLAETEVSMDWFDTYTTPVPAGTKYVAIDLVTLGTYLYWGFFEVEDYVIFDNFSLTELNEPVLMVADETMNFGNVVYGGVVDMSTSVVAALLTDPIAVSTTANFEVSTDGNTYAASTTLPVDGGTLFVRYNPAAAGSHTGTVTLTSGSATATIALTANSYTCDAITTFPFVEDFAETSTTRGCWEIVDANEDGNTIFFNYLTLADESTMPVAGYLYSEIENANDWLISPELVLPANMQASFDYLTAGSYGPEAYSVYVIPAGQTYETATNVVPTQTVDNTDFATQVVDLAAYANQTIRVAIKAESEADKYWIVFSNFTVCTAGTGIQEVANNSTVVYPNPANNVINVNSTSNINSVEVYTIAGQKVADYTANGTQAAISVSNLSNGMYLMKINTENGASVKKFNVVR